MVYDAVKEHDFFGYGVDGVRLHTNFAANYNNQTKTAYANTNTATK